MYNIYFEDKIISFTDAPDATCGEVIELHDGDFFSTTKMLEIVENSKHICVKTDDVQGAFNSFCGEFRMVEAAGGVVENERGEWLMIYRNGRWDLPKGHVEAGESPEQAAVREVAEETGLAQVELGEEITTTLHIYQLSGEWVMKKTYWYAMTGRYSQLKPQTEEGISQAEWVAQEGVWECVAGAFASIRAVVERAIGRREEQAESRGI